MRMFKKILLILIFVSFLTGSFCLAQRELEIEYPELGVPGVETPTTARTILTEFIKYIFTFAIVLAGLLAFGSLIYGGIRYLTSAGDPTKMSDGKNQVMAGFLGLIILLSSYLILNTINPQLVLKETPAIESLEQGIYAFVKTGCVDDPEDFFDDPVSISQSSPDLSIVLPKDTSGVPQSLQCIEFRSGKEELTVKVCSGTDFREPCTSYEGDPGETENVTGKSIKLEYHPPGVYLYSNSTDCGNTKINPGIPVEEKIYQSKSATLPEFDNKTQSIKFVYGFSDKGTIKISKEEVSSREEAEEAAEIRCGEKGGEKIGFITETEKEYQYRCIIYDKKYAAILHEKENYIGTANLYDQTPEEGCRNIELPSGGVSSITVYLKPIGEPIGQGVKFWGDKNYTKEKDDVETIYYGDGETVANLEIIDANDKITSMEMDGHYVALLFRDPNYQGDCEVFMSSCPDFRSHRIGQCGWMGRNDCLSSFIIKTRK